MINKIESQNIYLVELLENVKNTTIEIKTSTQYANEKVSAEAIFSRREHYDADGDSEMAYDIDERATY